METITKKAVAKIKKENIVPKAKWQFLLRNNLLWTMSILVILIGSLAASVTLFLLTDNDWDVYKYTDKNLLESILLVLPYFWLLIIFIFILLAYYNVSHTTDGYKYRSYAIILASVLISLVAGIIMFYAGLGTKIDDIFSNKVPYYNNLVNHKTNMWIRPDDGLLAGKVAGVKNDQIILMDFNNKKWIVKITSNTIIKGRSKLQVGGEIKLIGKANIKTNNFVANEIRPWGNSTGKEYGVGRYRR
jgi:hypothetical protein